MPTYLKYLGFAAVWAMALPPLAVAHPKDAPNAAWFNSLQNSIGQSCCGIADCHAVDSKSPGHGLDLDGWWVYISKTEFGDQAPDKWLRVPDKQVIPDTSDQPRPLDAVACWFPRNPFGTSYGPYGGVQSTPDGMILCFRPPRAQG